MLRIAPLMLSMLSLAPLGDSGDGWLVEYESYIEGPRTVFEGTARLYATEEAKFPCFNYCFSLPKGRLEGMIPFDWWERSGNDLEVVWCRDTLPLNLVTGEDLQSYPIQTPRHFKFYIIKTEFNSDDLSKMLSDWGPARLIDAPWPELDYTWVSPWDLNGDTAVDGEDLAILLAGWKVE